jgi:hypothetical protein
MALLVAVGLAAVPPGAALAAPVDDPLATDAMAYAERFGVSQDEALRRLRLQESIGILGATLEAAEPATYGGLSIENEPSYRVIVRFTEGTPDLAAYVHDRAVADLITVVPVQTSLARLREAAAESIAAAVAAGIDGAVSVDVRTNRVVVEVVRSTATRLGLSASSAERQPTRLTLPPEAVIVEVATAPSRQLNIYGGLALPTTSSGSGANCTTGFAVKNQYGTRGVTTAGHCTNTRYFGGTLLPFIHSRYGGSYDVQWHTAPGHTVQPWVRDIDSAAPTPYYRVITGTRHRNQQAAGQWVCKTGMVTHYTCGTIDKTDYTPMDMPSPAATYIRVQGNLLGPCLSDYGDSGAPWFSGGIAVGTHGGGGCTFDERNYSYYMAINYLSGLNPGVTILLG